ncbi:MAG: hypothetical protein M9934_09625 [Thermomicrobiales bacterium]|nr:hypothetical protein [Thermomicrobiales bacterium]
MYPDLRAFNLPDFAREHLAKANLPLLSDDADISPGLSDKLMGPWNRKVRPSNELAIGIVPNFS